MSKSGATIGGRAKLDLLRSDLKARLGLGADANDQDTEGTHREIIDFLDTAPESIRPWAERAAGDADEALALLSGPDAALLVADRQAHAAVPAAAAPPAAAANNRLPWILLGVLAAIMLVFGVWYLGRPATAVPEMTAAESSQSGPALDQALVADLMKKVTANPKDTASLQKLGNEYFRVGDFKNATAFLTKAQALAPKDKDTLLLLGASQFNGGDLKGAEKTWLDAEKAFPNDAEVQYDLGFLYMTTTPPQMDKMKSHWDKVVALDPNSDWAKLVQQNVGAVKPSSSASASK